MQNVNKLIRTIIANTMTSSELKCFKYHFPMIINPYIPTLDLLHSIDKRLIFGLTENYDEF